MIDRAVLTQSLNGLLQPERFKDYCHNGLQVEGRTQVRSIVTGVTASLALIEAAVAQRADALLVHHGLFWRGFDGQVSGWLRMRLALLMVHDINLWAYHLPLDGHPELGNNAQLGLRLGLHAIEGTEGRFGETGLGWMGHAASGQCFESGAALAAHIDSALQHPVVLIEGQSKPLRRIAWCTGGAQGYFEAAIAAGADAFITGEISEPQAHYARESGVAYLACGHHATERYGVQAVGAHLAREYGIDHHYIEIDNPA
jgi:dinuclear metal center YbgI/SA1388 family protein